MKFSEVKKAMKEFNSKHGIERKVCTKHKEDGTLIEMKAYAILKQELFKTPRTDEERKFEFSNYNKALASGDLGFSIFAYCEKTKEFDRIENLSNDDIQDADIIYVVE